MENLVTSEFLNGEQVALDPEPETLETESHGPVAMPDDVLIVSENLSANEYLAERLSAEGCLGVHLATDCSEATEAIARERPGTVLLDSRFITRSLVLDAIRQDVATRESAVIIIDSHGATPDERARVHVCEIHAKTDEARALAKQIQEFIVPADSEPTPMDDASEPTSLLHLREPRFGVIRGRQISSTISIDLEGEVFELPVELIDLSRDGAKIQSKLHLPAGTPLTMKLLVRRCSIDLTIGGEVKWCQLNVDDTSRIGCSFFVEVPEDVIQQLAEQGYLERRGDARKSVSIDVLVKQELSATPPVVGQIIDYSASGLRLSLPTPIKLGARLLVEPQSTETETPIVAVRTLWQRSHDGGCEVGCCFLSTSGRDVIRRLEPAGAAVPSRRSKTDRRKTQAMRLSPTWWIGLVAIIGLVVFRLMSPWDADAAIQGNDVLRQLQQSFAEFCARIFDYEV